MRKVLMLLLAAFFGVAIFGTVRAVDSTAPFSDRGCGQRACHSSQSGKTQIIFAPVTHTSK
jgi:hypothetical protein